MSNLKCTCGKIIPDENIEWDSWVEPSSWDDVTHVQATCECGKEYEYHEWSYADNLEEAKEKVAYSNKEGIVLELVD